MIFKRDLNDIAAAAIMMNEPVIIVEGKDDRQIYQNMVDEFSLNGKVYQVNFFEDYTTDEAFASGCNGVMRCLEILQPKFDERPGNIKYLLGIIDRDSRPYRALRDYEVDPTTLRGLFVLKYYSIETYFATRANLGRLLAKMTAMLEGEIPEDAIDFIAENITDSLANIYLISLEALKNACVEGYEKAIGYDRDGGIAETNAQAYLINQINPKKTDLEQFAILKGVNIDCLKQICKGKWYLYNYVYRANHMIELLSTECRNNKIPQCESCRVGNYADCLYTLKRAYSGNAVAYLYDNMLSFVDEVECRDILQRFGQLAN